ncbi:MAG: response regulator transcription factor [bacterium]|nr:response regulator transcription factor [bacterium]
MSPARIFLVEDEHLTRVGTRAVLEDQFDIVGEADNVTDAVDMIRHRKPDLVILDIRIREGSGAEVLRQVRKTDPDIVFLAVTVSTSRHAVAQLFHEGVDGYLTKQAIGPDLPDLVNQALRGKRPISRQVAGFLLDIDEDVADESGIARLTPREREVVVLIAKGFTYRETAGELGIAVKTLENHIHSIFEKLGIASRHKLSAIAYGTGFVDPEA